MSVKAIGLWALIFAVGMFMTIVIAANVQSSRVPAPVVSCGTK